MSAKLTIIFYILICFEIGLLLVILPWLDHPSWNENFLLFSAVDKLQWPWLGRFMTSGYLRGAVTGLGFLNIMLGAWELINFKKTVNAFQIKWQSEEFDTKPFETAVISDNRPVDVATRKE